MDNDLERAARLLEESLLSFRKTATQSHIDLSITMNRHEREQLMNRESLHGESVTTLVTEKSMTGSVIEAGEPWTTIVDSLYTEFFEITQNFKGDILEFLQDLARCCSDAFELVKGLKGKVAIEKLQELDWLEHERNTWRLLFVLYSDRLNARNLPEPPRYLGDSEKLCVANLFQREYLIREIQLVIDWLERNNLERVEQSNAANTDTTSGWEHTIHEVIAPEAIALGNGEKIVKNIHPDAPSFEHRQLHPLDEENEKKLLARVFGEIRNGRLEAAQELLVDCQQNWRASLLEGWKLYHDPNIKEDPDASWSAPEESNVAPSLPVSEEFDSATPLSVPGDSDAATSLSDSGEPRERAKAADAEDFTHVEGNRDRDVWKANAWRLSDETDLHILEKAAIGANCGNLKAMLAVSTNWEDYLWAYLRTIIDIRVEDEIRNTVPKKYEPMSDEYWQQRMTLNEIFKVLEKSDNEKVQLESQQPFYVIDKFLILENMKSLINQMETWSCDAKTPMQFLRFLTHLVLFFYQVGEGHNKDGCEKIIESYIERLSENMETELLAFYVSKLDYCRQAVVYSEHLEKITKTEERKAALHYGDVNDIDIFTVTKMVVENIRNRPTGLETSRDITKKTTEEDQFKISALDWLLFYDNQLMEVLVQCNALIFDFLTKGKQDAAQQAIQKIPSDILKKIATKIERNEDAQQIVKEHFSYKTLLEAVEAFNNWFKQFESKPTFEASEEKEHAGGGTQLSKEAGTNQKLSQQKGELERWKLTTAHLAGTAKTMLYNVLLFPEGWFSGSENSDYLRSICIPDTCVLLYSMLHKMGSYREVTQLADLIASEKYCLYKVFPKEKLSELLDKMGYCWLSMAAPGGEEFLSNTPHLNLTL